MLEDQVPLVAAEHGFHWSQYQDEHQRPCKRRTMVQACLLIVIAMLACLVLRHSARPKVRLMPAGTTSGRVNEVQVRTSANVAKLSKQGVEPLTISAALLSAPEEHHVGLLLANNRQRVPNSVGTSRTPSGEIETPTSRDGVVSNSSRGIVLPLSGDEINKTRNHVASPGWSLNQSAAGGYGYKAKDLPGNELSEGRLSGIANMNSEETETELLAQNATGMKNNSNSGLLMSTMKLVRFRQKNCGCKRILLVVIFNHPFYDNVPYLHTLYGSVFCHIVHYGPKADNLFDVRLQMDSTEGAHQHKTITQAFRDFPQYHGYLWVGDDVILNTRLMFARLRRLSLDNVWLQRYDESRTVDLANLPQTWAWKHPFNASTSSDTLVTEWHKRVPHKFKQRQKIVFGGEVMVGVGSDTGYIPTEFMEDFAVMTDILPTLTFEIFIPTVARLLTNDTSRVQDLNGLYLWTRRDRHTWFRRYITDYHDFVHPVKLSSDWARRDVERIVNYTWSPPPNSC